MMPFSPVNPSLTRASASVSTELAMQWPLATFMLPFTTRYVSARIFKRTSSSFRGRPAQLVMAGPPNPSFAGLTRESSEGDGRVKHGHDDLHSTSPRKFRVAVLNVIA